MLRRCHCQQERWGLSLGRASQASFVCDTAYSQTTQKSHLALDSLAGKRWREGGKFRGPPRSSAVDISVANPHPRRTWPGGDQLPGAAPPLARPGRPGAACPPGFAVPPGRRPWESRGLRTIRRPRPTSPQCSALRLDAATGASATRVAVCEHAHPYIDATAQCRACPTPPGAGPA